MDWIRHRFETFGTRQACIEGARTWSFRDLHDRILAEAADLPPGRRVLPMPCGSTVEALTRLLAIAGSQHIALPLSPELTDAERIHKETIAGVGSEALHPLCQELPGSGLVLFSSGTSGEPKGMLHSLPALIGRFERLTPRSDRTLQLLRIDHIGGLDAALRCLCAGSTLVIPRARTPEAAGEAIQAHAVNVLPASPTFLNLMLLEEIHTRYDCGSIDVIAYGAEPMPASVLTRLRQAFPKARLQQKFGTSETGAVRIQSAGDDSLFFRIEDSDTEWQVIEGELWLKTPSRILGYLNAGDSGLEADGWYRTGDLVEQDGDQLRIIGRKSEWINVGGQKVHPAEVAAVLQAMPGVDACRVFGEADPITGQHVACEIISQSPEDARSWKRAIRQHCRGRLAPWKIPSSLTLRPSLAVNERLKQAR